MAEMIAAAPTFYRQVREWHTMTRDESNIVVVDRFFETCRVRASAIFDVHIPAPEPQVA